MKKYKGLINDNYLIYLLIIIGILIRGVIIFINYDNPYLFTSPDSKSYEVLGLKLFKGEFDLITDRTPVYPLFLEISKLIFKSGYLSVIFSQTILFSILVILLFKITKKIHNKRSAYFAITLCIVDISFLFFSLQNLTEFLTAFIILSILYFYANNISLLNKVNLFIIFLLVILSLTKPMAIVFVYGYFLIILLQIFKYYKKRILKPTIKLFISFIIFFTCISFWSVYNYNKIGMFTLSPSNFSYMFFYVKKINIENQVKQTNSKVLICQKWTTEICDIYSSHGNKIEYNHDLPVNFNNLKYKDKNKYYFKKSINLIFTYPIEIIKDTSKRIVYIMANISDQSILKLLQLERLSDNAFRYLNLESFINNTKEPSFQFLFWIVNFIILIVIWASFFIGAFNQLIIKNKYLYFNLLITASILFFIFFPALVGIGNARFRVPIIPILLIYSGIGLDLALQKISKFNIKSS